MIDETDRLRAENANLRRIAADHPAVETLRFVAPFITAALDAGLWADTPGADAVRRELRHGLGLVDALDPDQENA